MEQLLRYPFDSSLILRKKRQIKKFLLEKNTNFLEKKIAVLGGSTTSELVQVLEIFLLECGIKPTFYESEYNMFYEDAVFENEALKAFSPDIIYIHTTNTNLKYLPSIHMKPNEVLNGFNADLERFKQIWQGLSRYNCPIIQNNFDYPVNRSMGNLDTYDPRGKTNYLTRLNLEFSKLATEKSNFYINDINYLSAKIGLDKWHDPSLWFSAKYAVSFDAIPELAHNITKIIRAIYGKAKKALVLDLDHTLWGGVIGDDGLNGIALGNETATGEAYLYFQSYIKELNQRGVILNIASKNDHENALLGLSHNSSVLRPEDFNVIKANWEPKHLNIANTAKEINIGQDALVFIDDNPVEREIVQNNIPAVSVPNIGDDVTKYIYYIEGEGYFEAVSISEDDLQRNRYYEADKKRQSDQVQFQSYDDFLYSLKMSAGIKSFESNYLDRITQLINKTNQFNLTTKRYTMSEVEAIANDNMFITLYGTLDDKFGSNGIISLLIAKIIKNECLIDTFLMSCRVLKRGMEQAMLDTLIETCKSRGIENLVGTYVPTNKNKMVEYLYRELGFNLVSNIDQVTTWKMQIINYTNQSKFIEIHR